MIKQLWAELEGNNFETFDWGTIPPMMSGELQAAHLKFRSILEIIFKPVCLHMNNLWLH